MLAFIASFIPHFSSALFPLFHLLRKKESNEKFEMTKEAKDAFDGVKAFLEHQTLLYHPDYTKPFYLTTDASQVGVGAFLYQVEIFDKTPEGEAECLRSLGHIPEQGETSYMIPGVVPGSKTPVVTNFLKDPNTIPDDLNTITTNKTMTDKLSNLNNKIIHIRPVCWFSKLFTSGQIEKYLAMEKEFIALFLAVNHFSDYIEASPITYVMCDSQPILWALKHRTSHVKLARQVLKMYEMNINLLFIHQSGRKNSVADFLSRLGMVAETGPSNNTPFKMGRQIVESK
jgi:hypothetical protein